MATCRSWTAWPGVVNRRESRRDADPRPSRPRKSGRYRFSWRGVRLARREEGAARRAVTDEATPSAGRPSVPVSWRGVRLARREEGAARRAVTGARQCAPRGPGVGLGAQPRLRKTKQRRPGGRLAGNWPGSGVGSRIAGAVPQVDVLAGRRRRLETPHAVLRSSGCPDVGIHPEVTLAFEGNQFARYVLSAPIQSVPSLVGSSLPAPNSSFQVSAS